MLPSHGYGKCEPYLPNFWDMKPFVPCEVGSWSSGRGLVAKHAVDHRGYDTQKDDLQVVNANFGAASNCFKPGSSDIPGDT